MQLARGIILIFLTGYISSVSAEDDEYRLPHIYVVNHYDIDLLIPKESFTKDSDVYSGTVQIEFQVTAATSEVKFHSWSNNTDIKSVKLQQKGKEDIIYENIPSIDETTDIITITFEDKLDELVDYTLSIVFEAQLLTSNGLYKESYTDENGEQFIVTTQFEPTHARKAFPCFDEPGYKATFTYKLTYPSDMTAWTNTANLPEDAPDEDKGLKTTSFEKTPKMSTYLVAFTISKFTCDDGELEGNPEIKHFVCSRPEKEDTRAWAMKVTPKVIEDLNSYTGVKYSERISKLHQVGIPRKSGAMENWGLVLYGEATLLYDETEQTNAVKQSVTQIISHELAHQWFGNLVTCKWWSEIFLNEGFATMFEYYTTAAVMPDFEMEHQYVIKIVQRMMVDDGNIGIPALRTNASTQNEISQTFSRYSYYKGGAILRMIEHIIGRDKFKSGIQKYLKDNQDQAVEPSNLWDALEGFKEDAKLEESLTLAEVVNNWITKSGYPLLTVKLEDGTLRISQKRFLLSEEDTEGTTWYVPVSYTTPENNEVIENTLPKGWLTRDEDLVIENFSDEWIIVNNQHTGYYRVNYDEALWNKLANALKQDSFSGIHVLNRAQIIEDSYNLAKAGLLTFRQVFKNVEFLEKDVSYFSWYNAVNLFEYLLSKTGISGQLGAAIKEHLLNISSVVSASVPLSELNVTNHIYTLNQALINNYVCKYGNAKCVSDAKNLFAEYRDNNSRPNINIRSIVYCNGIRHSENPNQDWEFLWQKYKEDSGSTDRAAIWAALGCSLDRSVLENFMSKIFDNDVIFNTQYASVFSAIYTASEIGVDTALDYFIENFEDILNRFIEFNMTTRGVIGGLGSALTTDSQIGKLNEFKNKVTDDNIVRYLDEAVTAAQNNQAIVEKHKNDLQEYFGLSDDEENEGGNDDGNDDGNGGDNDDGNGGDDDDGNGGDDDDGNGGDDDDGNGGDDDDGNGGDDDDGNGGDDDDGNGDDEETTTPSPDGALTVKASGLLDEFNNKVTDDNIVRYVAEAIKAAQINQAIVEKHKNDLHEYFGLSADSDGDDVDEGNDDDNDDGVGGENDDGNGDDNGGDNENGNGDDNGDGDGGDNDDDNGDDNDHSNGDDNDDDNGSDDENGGDNSDDNGGDNDDGDGNDNDDGDGGDGGDNDDGNGDDDNGNGGDNDNDDDNDDDNVSDNDDGDGDDNDDGNGDDNDDGDGDENDDGDGGDNDNGDGDDNDDANGGEDDDDNGDDNDDGNGDDNDDDNGRDDENGGDNSDGNEGDNDDGNGNDNDDGEGGDTDDDDDNDDDNGGDYNDGDGDNNGDGNGDDNDDGNGDENDDGNGGDNDNGDGDDNDDANGGDNEDGHGDDNDNGNCGDNEDANGDDNDDGNGGDNDDGNGDDIDDGNGGDNDDGNGDDEETTTPSPDCAVTVKVTGLLGIILVTLLNVF